MRVIITGGTGLIGQALSRKLIDAGHEVFSLTRDRSTAEAPPGVKLLEWDAKTGTGWQRHINNNTAIVNLAGANLSGGLWTESRKKMLRDSRLNSGKAVVDAVKNASAPPRILVQASAVGHYGDRGDEILTADSEPGSDYLANLTQEWEASTAAVESLGVSRVIVRMGVVLSTQGGAFPIMSIPFKLFVGGKLGNGKQYVSWIHIQDAVDAIYFLLRIEELAGVFTVTSPNPIQNKEFATGMGKALGRPALIPVPAFAVRALVGEMGDTVLKGQRVIPKRLREAGFEFKFPDFVEAVRDVRRRNI